MSHRTRDRAHMVRLNSGWNAIAEMFECCEHTVRATLRRWQQWDWVDCGMLLDGETNPGGRLGLFGQQCLEQEARTYTVNNWHKS